MNQAIIEWSICEFFLRVLIVKSIGTFLFKIAFSKAFEVFEVSDI